MLRAEVMLHQVVTCHGRYSAVFLKRAVLANDVDPYRLISAIAVTIPSCYFLWPSESHGDAHGAHGGHGEHAEHEEHDEAEEHDEGGEPKEESEGEQEEASKEDDAKVEESSKDDSEGSDDKPAPEDDPATKNKEDDSAQGTEKPPQSDAPKEGQNQSGANTDGENMPESKGKVDGVQFKGKTNKGDDDNEMPDTRKREPDSKGAFKKRIDSGYGKNLGEGPQKQDDDREAVRNMSICVGCFANNSRRIPRIQPQAAMARSARSNRVFPTLLQDTLPTLQMIQRSPRRERASQRRQSQWAL